jgi:NADP-dependent 3-hydroxy acid dehydrogenase YdfG
LVKKGNPMTDYHSTSPALVFGGSRGMGAAIVRRLAAEGRPVAFTYVQAAEKAEALAREVEAAGGRAVAILQADSADADAIRATIETAVEQFGKIGVLVVNAGVLDHGTIDAFSMEAFDRMVAVNIRGVYAAIHHAAPQMLEGGRIVTIGSNTAGYIGSAGSSVYAMTKAAVAQLVRGRVARLRSARDHDQQCPARAGRNGHDRRAHGFDPAAAASGADREAGGDRRAGRLAGRAGCGLCDRRQPDHRWRVGGLRLTRAQAIAVRNPGRVNLIERRRRNDGRSSSASCDLYARPDADRLRRPLGRSNAAADRDRSRPREKPRVVRRRPGPMSPSSRRRIRRRASKRMWRLNSRS